MQQEVEDVQKEDSVTLTACHTVGPFARETYGYCLLLNSFISLSFDLKKKL